MIGRVERAGGVLHARGGGRDDMESRECADVRVYTTWSGADGPGISGTRDAFRFPTVAWGTSKACTDNAWTRGVVTQTADVACRNRQPGRKMGRPHSGLRQDHGVLEDPKSLGVQRMRLSLRQIEPSPHNDACNARSLQKIGRHRFPINNHGRDRLTIVHGLLGREQEGGIAGYSSPRPALHIPPLKLLGMCHQNHCTPIQRSCIEIRQPGLPPPQPQTFKFRSSSQGPSTILALHTPSLPGPITMMAAASSPS